MKNCKLLSTMLLMAGAVWSAGAGCSASPMGFATSIVGDVVNDQDVAEKAKAYIGEPVSVADEKLGGVIDTYRDINSPRQWRVYPVAIDPLGMSRYVIEVMNGRIVAVTKSKKFGDPAIGIAQQTIAFEKVRGQSPSECAQSLGESPLLTARSESTGQLVQLYDASLIDIEGVSKPDYYVLRFDNTPACTSLNVVVVSASSKSRPTQG